MTIYYIFLAVGLFAGFGIGVFVGYLIMKPMVKMS